MRTYKEIVKNYILIYIKIARKYFRCRKTKQLKQSFESAEVMCQ